MVKCYNMVSNRGNAAANQFCIHDAEHSAVYFQSYRSLIAKYSVTWEDGEVLILGKRFDYSVTTVKWLHKWIDENCTSSLAALIEHAPGGSYAAKLWHWIDRGLIQYDANML